MDEVEHEVLRKSRGRSFGSFRNARGFNGGCRALLTSFSPQHRTHSTYSTMSELETALQDFKVQLQDQHACLPETVAEPEDYEAWGKEFVARLVSNAVRISG
jgi:hypothetical protein